eukprot:gnl/Chilomastix_cuspidata/2580.p1 GENE.gnl/Chilomastix_cuspidata/2580~~gnl/Chilomastix_cuspidata/2580.p1  ORF type:complete len:808 (+),score=267.75 gnl/Chilomastix_cuspidata/2580:55-2478(+)
MECPSSAPRAFRGDGPMFPSQMYENIRKSFVDYLFKLHWKNGTPITKLPVIEKKELDLYKLFLLVEEFDGIQNVIRNKKFKQIGKRLGISDRVTNVGYVLRTKYNQFILPVEGMLRAKFLPALASKCSPLSARLSVVNDGLGVSDMRLSALSLPPTRPKRAPSNMAHGTRGRPGLMCPGCGERIQLAQFQQHLFDCNLDFYIECFGVAHPEWSERSVRHARALTAGGARSANPHVFVNSAEELGAQEIEDILEALARKERRRVTRRPDSTKEAGADADPEPLQTVSSLLINEKARTMCEFPPARTPIDKTIAPRRFIQKEATSAEDGAFVALRETTQHAFAPFLARYSAFRSESMKNVFEDSVLAEDLRRLCRYFLDQFSATAFRALVRSWPFPSLPLVALPALTESMFSALDISPDVEVLEVGSLPTDAVFERWPRQAGQRLRELRATNWPSFTPAALEAALRSFPNLEVLHIHAALDLCEWPRGFRYFAHMWHFHAAQADSAWSSPAPPAPDTFPGLRLQEVILFGLHPFFNLAMLAEAAPNLERCRLVYAPPPDTPDGCARLQRDLEQRQREFEEKFPSFAAAVAGSFEPLAPGRGEDAPPAPLLFPPERDRPYHDFFNALRMPAGDAVDPAPAPPPGSVTFTIEPTFRLLAPRLSPAHYGLSGLRRLTFLRLEGAVDVEIFVFCLLVPALEEMEIVRSRFQDVSLERVPTFLSAPQRAALVQYYRRFAALLEDMETHKKIVVDEKKRKKFVQHSAVVFIIRLLLKKLDRISVTDCKGRSFDQRMQKSDDSRRFSVSLHQFDEL